METIAQRLHELDDRLRTGLAVLVAAGTGLAQFAVFFAGGGAPWKVVLAASALAAAGGAAIGALTGPGPRALLSLAGCWGAALAGAIVLLGSGHSAGYALLAAPPALALLAARSAAVRLGMSSGR